MQLSALQLSSEFLLPSLKVLAMTIRPLVGIAMASIFVMVFHPLLGGLLKAAMLLIAPRKSLPERRRHQNLLGMRLLHRLAHDVESSQPNMAAELRSFATRD